jgi:glutamate-1-semialdehyde 2,1-aminomutase
MAAGYMGLNEVFTPEVCREFNAMGDKLRERLQEIGKGTKMAVTGRGTIMGIHFLHDGRKELRSFRDRHEDADLRRLFWFEMMEEGFWVTERGSVALILGTPTEDLNRFLNCVDGFLERHKELVRV